MKADVALAPMAIWRRIPRSVILFGLKVGGAGLAFLTNVVVARMVSPAIAGTYFGLLAAVTLLYAVARYGLGYSTAKLVAAADAQGNGDLVGATMVASVQMVKRISAAVTVVTFVALIVAPYLGVTRFPLLAGTVMICSIAPFSIGSIVMEGVRGMRRSLEFGLFDSLVFKLVILSGLVCFGYMFGLSGLALGYVGATIVNMLLARRMFRVVFAEGIDRRFSNQAQADLLRRVTGRLGIVSVATVAVQWAPTLIVSLLLPPATAAVYFAAFRTAAVLEFIVTAANVVVGPELVRAASLHGMDAMRAAARKAALGAMAGTATLAVPLFLFAPQIMTLFGHGYSAGAPLLRVLVIGQLVAAPLSFGLPALIAAGLERRAAIASALGTTIGIALIVAGAKAEAAIGAAVGQAGAVILIAAAFTTAAFFKRSSSWEEQSASGT